MTTMHAVRPDNLARGVAFAVASMFMFAVMDAISRVLTRDLGLAIAQILWARFVIFFLFALAIIGPRRFLPSFRSAMPRMQILRAVALFLSVAIPIGFIAVVDHYRQSTGFNWVGALGALVALSLVIAVAVVAGRK